MGGCASRREPIRLREIESIGSGALAQLDLPAEHYAGYYEGFANSALWPALHSRMDLIRASAQDYNSYCAVNAFMARSLLRFQQPDTMFWVQGYHFLVLGAELRKLGVSQPLGLLPAYTLAGGACHGEHSASPRVRRSNAGLRPDRLPDR